MSRRQQVVLGALAALVLASLVTLLVLSSDGGDDDVAAGTSTSGPTSSTAPTSTTSTSTTAPAGATTTAGAVTTAPGGPGSTAAPSPVVTGQGAVLRALTTAETRTQPPGVGCEGLADAGWTAECAFVNAGSVRLAWLLESRQVPGGFTARRAFVFRHVRERDWVVALRARDESGGRFAAIRTRVEDASGDGVPEIAFGFRLVGEPVRLAVDLVQAPGTVVAHRTLDQGAARVSTGQVDLWRALTPGGTTYAHEVIQYRDGAWRIVASTTVAGSDVPPSQL